MSRSTKIAHFINAEDSLGTYLGEIADSKPLSAEQEIELAKSIKKGDKGARNKLVNANLRFVVSIAKNYYNKGVPLNDLISAGNVGLITAAERFDETKGFKFISYGVWWIRQAILQTLAEQSRVVRLPLNRVGLLHKIFKVSNALQGDSPQSTDTERIAKELNITPEEVKNALISGQTARSLDAPFSDDDENCLLDILSNDQQLTPDDLMLENALKDQIGSVLETLRERESEIIKLYFGLDGQEPMTLDQIGVKFKLTRERVRQIKEVALQKLRHPKRQSKLKPYMQYA